MMDLTQGNGKAGMDGLEIWHYIPHRIKNRTEQYSRREIERGLKLMMMAWLFSFSSFCVKL
jgi:hypothetical protein